MFTSCYWVLVRTQQQGRRKTARRQGQCGPRLFVHLFYRHEDNMKKHKEVKSTVLCIIYVRVCVCVLHPSQVSHVTVTCAVMLTVFEGCEALVFLCGLCLFFWRSQCIFFSLLYLSFVLWVMTVQSPETRQFYGNENVELHKTKNICRKKQILSKKHQTGCLQCEPTAIDKYCL